MSAAEPGQAPREALRRFASGRYLTAGDGAAVNLSAELEAIRRHVCALFAAIDAQEASAPEDGQYVIFRKTDPGCYPTAHGPYSEAEADRLSKPGNDSESRLKLLLGRDLED